LDFLIIAEGKLAWPPVLVQPLRFANLDDVGEALKKLQLCALEARALEGNQLLNFKYRQLKC
jgi:hypothetical protein